MKLIKIMALTATLLSIQSANAVICPFIQSSMLTKKVGVPSQYASLVNTGVKPQPTQKREVLPSNSTTNR